MLQAAATIKIRAVLAGQCLDRRIPSIEVLREEIAAWEGPRNQLQTKIHWPFSNEVARTKLKRLYPPLETAQNLDPSEAH